MELQARFSTELEREKLVSATAGNLGTCRISSQWLCLGEGGGAKAWEAGVRPSCQPDYATDVQWAIGGSSVFVHCGFIEHLLCARHHAKDIKVKDMNLLGPQNRDSWNRVITAVVRVTVSLGLPGTVFGILI